MAGEATVEDLGYGRVHAAVRAPNQAELIPIGINQNYSRATSFQ